MKRKPNMTGTLDSPFAIVEQTPTWQEVAELAYAFLESLPHGWLAHTTGDIGALNEFYIKYRKAKFPTS